MLLDTCTLLWLTNDRSRISRPAMDQLRLHAAHLRLSAISVFEIGILIYRKRVELDKPLNDWVAKVAQDYRLEILPVTWTIAAASTKLADLHRDPADRIIIATAGAHGLSIVTPDPKIAAYPEVRVVW